MDNHLPRVPISPNQQGTFEMTREVLSSVGAQDTDTSGYELSDLEDFEFSWDDPAVDMDSVYWPGIDSPFSPFFLTFSDVINRYQPSTSLNNEEDQENSAPTTTTRAESERPTEPPRWLRNRPFGTGSENAPNSVYSILFHYILYVFVFGTLYVFCIGK